MDDINKRLQNVYKEASEKRKIQRKRFILKVIICAFCLAIVAASIAVAALYANGTIRYTKPVQSLSGKYLFAYFVGNGEGEEQIHLATSEDGYHFKALNDDKSIIFQSTGTQCARDPYIIKAQDGSYYIVATDMRSADGWTSNHALVTWHSKDLITWSEETNIDMRRFKGFETCNRAWAPQAIWNSQIAKYMVYFTATTEEKDKTDPAIYYCLTSDFKVFSEPKLLFAPEGNCIDADIVFNKAKNMYYLYFKDERTMEIAFVSSKSLTGPYESEPVVVSFEKNVEGSSMYNINGTDTWVMMMDAYSKNKFVAIRTTDFENFTKLREKDYDYTARPRHGSIVSISDEEYNKLVNAFGFEVESTTRSPIDLLVSGNADN